MPGGRRHGLTLRLGAPLPGSGLSSPPRSGETDHHPLAVPPAGLGRVAQRSALVVEPGLASTQLVALLHLEAAVVESARENDGVVFEGIVRGDDDPATQPTASGGVGEERGEPVGERIPVTWSDGDRAVAPKVRHGIEQRAGDRGDVRDAAGVSPEGG